MVFRNFLLFLLLPAAVLSALENTPLLCHFGFDGGSLSDDTSEFFFSNSGAKFANDRCGIKSSSIYFDGESSLKLQESPHPTDANLVYSYTFWAKFMSMTSEQVLIESGMRRDQALSSIRFIPESISDLGLSFVGWSNNFYSKFHPPVGVWLHYAITRSRKSISLYIDGELHSTGELPEMSSQTDSQIILGKGLDDDTAFFHGYLDEFRIYDSALETDEIRELFASESCLHMSNKQEEIQKLAESLSSWNGEQTTLRTSLGNLEGIEGQKKLEESDLENVTNSIQEKKFATSASFEEFKANKLEAELTGVEEDLDQKKKDIQTQDTEWKRFFDELLKGINTGKYCKKRT